MLTFLTVCGVSAANGERVSVSISANQRAAQKSNAIWNCQSYLELDGNNSSKSKNSLYVQCYEQCNKSFDRKEKEYLLAEGMSSSVRWKLNAYNSGRAYYVKLNPKGALSKGCKGSGTLYD